MCLTDQERATISPPCLDCEDQMDDPDNYVFNDASGELRQLIS